MVKSRNAQLAITAAKEAGAFVRKSFSQPQEIKRKGFNDYRTETDIKAEEIVINHLQKTGYSFFGEETGNKKNTNTDRKWIIDPIDGTTNFIRGIPFFANSIALIEDNKTLLLGVVYNPIDDKCYWAERKKGAYLNGERIHVSETESFDGAIVLLEHNRSKEGKKDYVRATEKLIEPNGPTILRQGGTALMLCYLARGSADAFLSSGDQIYDYAAGLIIAEEAGATVSDWNGRSWKNTNSRILATTPGLRQKILDRVSSI